MMVTLLGMLLWSAGEVQVVAGPGSATLLPAGADVWTRAEPGDVAPIGARLKVGPEGAVRLAFFRISLFLAANTEIRFAADRLIEVRCGRVRFRNEGNATIILRAPGGEELRSSTPAPLSYCSPATAPVPWKRPTSRECWMDWKSVKAGPRLFKLRKPSCEPAEAPTAIGRLFLTP